MGVSRSATRKWKMFFNIIKMSIIKCAAHTSKLKFKFTSVLKSSWRRLGTDPLTPLLKENFLTFVNHTLLGGDYIVNFNLVWNFSLVSQAEISACGSEKKSSWKWRWQLLGENFGFRRKILAWFLKPGYNFQPGQTGSKIQKKSPAPAGWNFSPGWYLPCNHRLSWNGVTNSLNFFQKDKQY